MNPHSDNQLSNFEIDNYLKKYKRFKGCFSKDKLTKNDLDKNCYYIINIQNSEDGNGSHWTCLYMLHHNMALYLDPMGYPAPEEIEELIPFIIWNEKPIQDLESTACGYYCIAFIKLSYWMKDKEKALKYFNEVFTSDTRKNDYILEKLLKIK
jgi:hypothetical protein